MDSARAGMSPGTSGAGPQNGPGSELGEAVKEFLRDQLSRPDINNLGPGTDGKAWEGVLVGFSSGADELYEFLKEHIGPFHWTPAEAFALGRSTDRPVPGPQDAADALAGELTVISWALCQTESAKAANRAETLMPSEPWARSRIFGQDCNRRLHKALVQMLADLGYEAVAPGLLPQWAEESSPRFGRACTWSERHVAYTSGLGTFSLSGGLITEQGQAVRFGSVVVRAQIPAIQRPYTDPFAYCLFFARGACGACARRCPVGSIRESGRHKAACAAHLIPVSEEFVKREYGFDGYGCGLCQTKVPCESGIPKNSFQNEAPPPGPPRA
jgi:epoxyqueuosine reductase